MKKHPDLFFIYRFKEIITTLSLRRRVPSFFPSFLLLQSMISHSPKALTSFSWTSGSCSRNIWDTDFILCYGYFRSWVLIVQWMWNWSTGQDFLGCKCLCTSMRESIFSPTFSRSRCSQVQIISGAALRVQVCGRNPALFFSCADKPPAYRHNRRKKKHKILFLT